MPRSGDRKVRLSDERLAAVAHATAEQVDWEQLIKTGPSQWKFIEAVGDFALFTLENSPRFSVLCIGAVPCSVPELLHLLEASTQEDHAQVMEDLYGDDYKDGAFLHHVDLEHAPELRGTLTADPTSIAQLSVKTVTFNKPSWWFSNSEEWCHVDAVYHHPGDEPAFEKLLTSVRPQDLFGSFTRHKNKHLDDLIVGYCVQTEKPSDDLTSSRRSNTRATARVHFYADYVMPPITKRLTSSGSVSPHAVHARMLRMARGCARLLTLIRRRRLGAQVLVDRNRILPPTNTNCIACQKSLLIAKLCRLCGQGVCVDCSAKHERQSLRGGNKTGFRVESVRVCVRCLDRVDRAEYSFLQSTSLSTPGVIPDPADVKPAAVALRTYLEDALVNAPTKERKVSVMNVIKCVLDQEPALLLSEPVDQESCTGVSSDYLLTPTSSEQDHLDVLRTRLDFDTLLLEECVFASTFDRAYRIQPGMPTETTPFPVPDNEEERVRVVQEAGIREFGYVEEFNIICQLATDELHCLATMISIVDRNDLFIAAASLAAFEFKVFPRAAAPCAHTIMDPKPILIRHPEADVRFQDSAVFKAAGVKYYCGFPLVAADRTSILGTICIVDKEPREITQSQYTTLKKLAETATKIIRVQSAKRRRGSSVTSSVTSSDKSWASEPTAAPAVVA